MDLKNIRNFSIVAHIDHGKSTLADRLLELTGAIDPRHKRDQILDSMELERERGITIKAKAVRVYYEQGMKYQLNLIDTPGHVDFSYEVSRSLKSCEGVLLLVDATQGIEAQTLANAYLALEEDLDIVPVINKIDVKTAEVDKVKAQLEKVFGFKKEEVILASAKRGDGTAEVLQAVVGRISPPSGDPAGPLRALVFDSSYDSYRGVVVFVRLVDGEIKEGQDICFFSSGVTFRVDEVGIFAPERKRTGKLGTGEVGYFISGIKDPRQAQVGDTVCDAKNKTGKALSGYKKIKPVVFCGIYPQAAEEYEKLKDALDKLRLSDAALSYQSESSQALSFGFRCGFLGKLHMEITIERLEREYDLDLIATTPSVVYRVFAKGEMREVQNPADFPEGGGEEEVQELYIEISVITPVEYMSPIINLLKDRRGSQKRTEFLDPERVLLAYEIPLAEVVIDLYDRLKSMSRGYASMDYSPLDYRPTQVVKVDVLVNKEKVEAFSFVCHRDKARRRSRAMVDKLAELIPRHMFAVPIQAAIGGEIIARSTVRAARKDVTAKCYGGDVTRKRKLLEKQKKGKKRMQSIGKVAVPKEAFLAALKLEE